MKIFSTLLIAVIISFSNYLFANTFKTEKWQTPNGVQVVFYQAMEVPMLDVSLAFAAGSAYDGNQYGLSALTTHMMNQGNAGKNATTIAQALADTGSQYDAETSRDMVILNLRTLTNKEAMDQSISTFGKIINHPDFPDDAFSREKKQQLMAIEQADESPDDVANTHFFEALYQQHPYAHPVNGTTGTVNTIKKQQVIHFYKQYYAASNATLVIVGAIDLSKAHQIAEQLTQELPKGQPAGNISKAKPLGKGEQIQVEFPSSQTAVRLGQIGIDHQNPHYFPLMVGNYILGGGSLVSKLATEVREKRGLTYGISSQFTPMPGNGPFIITLSTKNNQANNALKITEDTLHQFINDGPDQQELEAAKQYLTGSFPLSLGSNRAIAGLLLRMAFYHLPDNYLDSYVAHINAVTVDDVKQAFKQQVNPEELLLVRVGRS
jgi:zinc protease